MAVTRSILSLLLSTALLVVLPATAALADPPQPTHYRSTVTGASGELGDTRVEVLGGDSYLVVHAAPGQEVRVPGYEGEPYLRVDPDGAVHVNVRSEARWLNDARYGAAQVEVPPQADNAAPPQWEQVAGGGTYAWHDHRIHWMSPGLPGQVDPGAAVVQDVFAWEIPLEVDGDAVTARGELVWVPGRAPVVPIVAAVVALAVVLLVARRGPWSAVAAVVGAVALLAVLVGAVAALRLPPGAQAQWLDVALPAIALVVLGAAATRRQRPAQAGVLTGLAGLPLVVWGALQLPALTNPILPSPLPDVLVRAVIAGALGGGLAGVLTAARPLLRPPDVDALLAEDTRSGG